MDEQGLRRHGRRCHCGLVRQAGADAAAGKRVLCMGAALPISAAGFPRRRQRGDPDFSTLPNAAEEIQRVTQFFPPRQMQVFRAESATPQAFFTSNPEFYRYIHFVAHGTNITLEPMDSASYISCEAIKSARSWLTSLAEKLFLRSYLSPRTLHLPASHRPVSRPRDERSSTGGEDLLSAKTIWLGAPLTKSSIILGLAPMGAETVLKGTKKK
jgi:hypothetical protein